MNSASPRKRNFSILQFLTVWFALIGLKIVIFAFADLFREVQKLPDEIRYEAGGAAAISFLFAIPIVAVENSYRKKKLSEAEG